jgi:hypothetical protein
VRRGLAIAGHPEEAAATAVMKWRRFDMSPLEQTASARATTLI